MEDPDPDLYHRLLQVVTRISNGTPDYEMIASLIAIGLLLFLSGAISASETAFFSLNSQQLNTVKRSDTKRGRFIQQLLEHPKRLLATILVSNIFINVAIVILSSFSMFYVFGVTNDSLKGLLLQVMVVSALILSFGEIMPKIYATQHSLKVACWMARPVYIAQQLLYPITTLLTHSTNVIDRRITHKTQNLTIDELSEALDLTTTQGESANDERKILQGIVKFGDIAVREIMRPRVDVTAVDDSASFQELLTIINDSGYSRIPIFTENLDNVTGILYIKDLIPHLYESGEFDWQHLQRPAFFVPENKRINDLLQEFQEKKIHMAIVVDEYGGTSGILTMEDILEEIVGEINDEFDSEIDQVYYTKIDDFNYVFEGKTLLNDFCKILQIDDRIFYDVKGESDTLAGLVLEMAGKIPEVDEHFTYANYTFKAEAVDKRSIKRIKVTIFENSIQ